MSAPTVPQQNTVIPAAPVASTATQETSPTLINAAQACATHKLKAKNRKGTRMELETPITLQFESATAYTFSGFGKDIDGKTWICDNVELCMSGKKGSIARIGFYLPPTIE